MVLTVALQCGSSVALLTYFAFLQTVFAVLEFDDFRFPKLDFRSSVYNLRPF